MCMHTSLEFSYWVKFCLKTISYLHRTTGYLASLPSIPKDWKPLKDFLLELGRSWEPDPWEYDDNPEDYLLCIQASQAVEQVEEMSTSVIAERAREKMKVKLQQIQLNWIVDGVLQSQMKK